MADWPFQFHALPPAAAPKAVEHGGTNGQQALAVESSLQRQTTPDAEDLWDQQDELLEEQFAAKQCRGLTHGYVRSEMQRARALVIGCNYPQSRNMRLWGACADARQWASTLTGRLGVPRRNMALMTDETADGQPADRSDPSYPSQRNLMEHMRWLTSDVESGDLLVFIFCGRGTIMLEEGADMEELDTPLDEDDDEVVQEGLLCADFDSADWVSGQSMRLLTSRDAAGFWELLPKGTSLTVVLDCENGLSMLPVSRRLDSARLPAELCLGSEPVPVLEALAFDVALTPAAARRRIKPDAPATGMPVPSDPNRGARGSQGVWPSRRWLRGQMFWEAAAGTDEPAAMDADVQAFAFVASGRSGHAYEALLSRKTARGAPGKSGTAPPQGQAPGPRQKGGPAKRRGVLTHCLHQALEESNFQGTYYALWWRATRVMLSEGYRDQSFQLTFSEGTDPTCREAFAEVGDSEARAFERKAKLDRVLADKAAPLETQCSAAACNVGQEIEGISPDDPLFSARGSKACGCSSLGGTGGKDSESTPPPCSLM